LAITLYRNDFWRHGGVTTDSRSADQVGWLDFQRVLGGLSGGGENVLSIAGSRSACEPFNTLNVLGGQVGLWGSSPQDWMIVSVLREAEPKVSLLCINKRHLKRRYIDSVKYGLIINIPRKYRRLINSGNQSIICSRVAKISL